jgi:acetolactate synthase-1/3 small subunit
MSSIFVASVQDSLQALNRVVSLLRGRNFRIDSLTMARSEQPEVARLTVLVDATQPRPQRVASCLDKLEEVWGVREVDPSEVVRRQAALVKVNDSEAVRDWIASLPVSGAARVAERSGGVAILELFGTPEEVEYAIASLPPDSIIECARLGQFVMLRTTEPTTVVTPRELPTG